MVCLTRFYIQFWLFYWNGKIDSLLPISVKIDFSVLTLSFPHILNNPPPFPPVDSSLWDFNIFSRWKLQQFIYFILFIYFFLDIPPFPFSHWSLPFQNIFPQDFFTYEITKFYLDFFFYNLTCEGWLVHLNFDPSLDFLFPLVPLYL